MIQDITFCIKTIHRPWSCHRLVESLRQHIADPKIIVVDDGLPEFRFSEKYPDTAQGCTVINLDQHDVGVGAGRNTAVDAVQTEWMFLLDDEPLLNPQIIEHILLARQHWADSDLMLVTNGLFLHRYPQLPSVLVEANCRLEVSQHGTHADYVDRFRAVKELVWQWRADHPILHIRIRQSHQGWMRQYNVIEGKPLPFDSDPDAAYSVCMQRTCSQLFQSRLFKCPALAYWAQLETKARLESIPEWQLFRDYQACSPNSTDDDLQSFIDTKSVPQCGLCPSKRAAFVHPSPLQRSVLQ